IDRGGTVVSTDIEWVRLQRCSQRLRPGGVQVVAESAGCLDPRYLQCVVVGVSAALNHRGGSGAVRVAVGVVVCRYVSGWSGSRSVRIVSQVFRVGGDDTGDR